MNSRIIKLLFVDDNKEILKLGKTFIEGIDKAIQVHIAISATEALRLLKKGIFDIIVSDYQMPLISGLNFFNILRKDANKSIPFILFSSQKDIAITALDKGVNNFIYKGGDIKTQFHLLVNAIRQEVRYYHIAENLEYFQKINQYLTKTIQDGIISINHKGQIIDWNNGAKKLFGYTSEEILFKSLTLIIPLRFRRHYQKNFNLLIETGKSFIFDQSVDFIGLRNDGEEFLAELSIASWKIKQEIFFTSVVRKKTDIPPTDLEIENKNKKFDLLSIVKYQT